MIREYWRSHGARALLSAIFRVSHRTILAYLIKNSNLTLVVRCKVQPWPKGPLVPLRKAAVEVFVPLRGISIICTFLCGIFSSTMMRSNYDVGVPLWVPAMMSMSISLLVTAMMCTCATMSIATIMCVFHCDEQSWRNCSVVSSVDDLLVPLRVSNKDALVPLWCILYHEACACVCCRQKKWPGSRDSGTWAAREDDGPKTSEFIINTYSLSESFQYSTFHTCRMFIKYMYLYILVQVGL